MNHPRTESARFCGKFVCMAALLIASTATQAAKSTALTNDQVKKQGTELLLAHDFKAFDLAATKYRTSMATTAEGYLRLQMLYAGIDDICPSDPNSPCWESFSKQSKDWLSSHKNSPTAVIVASQFSLQYAQNLRGQETAAETSDAAMHRFEERVADAKFILDGSREAAATDPAWYELQIQTANYQGADKQVILDLASRGLAIAPNFFGIHFSAFDALTVRWGGSVKLINQFLAEAARKAGALGSDYYARLAYRIVRGYGTNELVADGFQWPMIRQSYDSIVKKYPANWNLNNYAAMACIAGDVPTLKALLIQIGAATDPNAWLHKPDLITQCRAIASKS